MRKTMRIEWRECVMGVIALVAVILIYKHTHPPLKPGELPSDSAWDYFSGLYT